MKSAPGAFKLLPRKKNTDKRDYGHVLVLAGSETYPGSALLCAKATLVSGAGLVSLAVPASIRQAVLKKFSPEIMPLFLPQTKKGAIAMKAFPILIRRIRERRVSVLAIGPGLTRERETLALVRRLIAATTLPIVLDADGLSAYRGDLDQLRKHRTPLVLTPHAGEFENLFDDKFSPRINLKKYNATFLLKGPETLVLSAHKKYRNLTGNPGLAKGGSGDVLTGVIAAFMAQGLNAYDAACWAAYFHGRAGDVVANKKSQLSVLASDLIDALPRVFLSKT